jgi:S-adenosyl methyltransferase
VHADDGRACVPHRQFLDIGTGQPSASNVHEVAQSIASDGGDPAGAGRQRLTRSRPTPTAT